MRARLLAALCVLPLTACSGLNKRVPPSFQPPPVPIPAELLEPCLPLSLQTGADGSLTSAGVEQAISGGDAALARCEAKRRLAVTAWPR